jgi:hypothetical protein
MRGMHISAVTSIRCLGRSNVLPPGNGSINILSVRNDSAISYSNHHSVREKLKHVLDHSECLGLRTRPSSGIPKLHLFPTRWGQGDTYTVGSLTERANLGCFLVFRILDNGQSRDPVILSIINPPSSEHFRIYSYTWPVEWYISHALISPIMCPLNLLFQCLML